MELNKTVVDFVNQVELKASRVQKVYESLDSIKTLRDELYEASNIMKRQIVDGRNSVQNFKEKSELEISNALSNISNTIEKEISLLEDKKTEVAKNEQFASDLKTIQTEKIINSFPEEKYQDILRQINELQKLNKSNEMDAASLTSKFKISLAIAIISILIAILSIAIN